ncbi:hypothetical protein GCM10023238_38560 [Streptomyces heliomycini]
MAAHRRPVVALALACAPAAWAAHLLAARVGRRLASSRGLEDFSASVRPVLIGVYVLFPGRGGRSAHGDVRAPRRTPALPSTLALGGLLFLARLLTIHGFTHAPRVILAVTAIAQTTALATLFAARLPGCDALATPVQTLTSAWSPAALPTLTCGTAALILLIHASRTLARPRRTSVRSDRGDDASTAHGPRGPGSHGTPRAGAGRGRLRSPEPAGSPSRTTRCARTAAGHGRVRRGRVRRGGGGAGGGSPQRPTRPHPAPPPDDVIRAGPTTGVPTRPRSTHRHQALAPRPPTRRRTPYDHPDAEGAAR